MLTIILSTLAGSVALANGLLFQPRAIQTQAICTADFTWMDNAEATSPCLMLAEVNAVCNGGNWIVPALAANGGDSYSNPNPASGEANFCTCSWVSYNLISACTVCQNPEFSQKIVPWTTYSENCLGELSDNYFPANIILPPGVSIPFWAAYDPTQWPNGIFNVTEVNQIVKQNYPDLRGTGATQSQKTRNIIVPVVGGVIGGSVFIAAAVAITYYVLGRQRRVPERVLTQPISDKPLHIRSISDITTNSGLNGYTTLSSPPLNQPAVSTMMTHSQSLLPIPYFSSVVGKTAPQRTPSPAPSRPTESSPPISAQHILDPFTSPPPSVSSHNDDTQPAYPVYDHSSAQLPSPL